MSKLFRSTGVVAVTIAVLICLSSCDTGYYDPITSWDSSSYRPPPTRTPQPQMRLDIPPSMFANEAGKLATLYCLTFANRSQVPEFVRKNRATFQNTQQTYQCIARFKAAGIQSMLNSPSPSESREAAFNVAGSNPTLLQHAPAVGDSMSSNFGDIAQMADIMDRLSRTVPSMLEGDDRAYYNVPEVQLAALLQLPIEYKVYIFNSGYQLMYPTISSICY